MDEGRVSRRQINQRTSKENGLREGRNKRVPPVCPMPFPLRSAWACSQISGPLCRTGAWGGLGHNAHNKTYTHTLTNVWKLGLKKKRFYFSIMSSCSSSLFCLWSLLLLLTPCICALARGFLHHQSIWIHQSWLHKLWQKHKHTVTHSLDTYCMLLSVWTLPSVLACGSSGWLSLIMPC